MPFPTSDRSLSGVRFRLTPSADPSPDTVRYVDDGTLDAEFHPELFLDVNVDQLASDTQLPIEDLVVSVIVRDRVLNWFQKIEAWPVDELPEDGWSIGPSLNRVSADSRIDIAVVATPRSPSAGIPDGTVLARKVFVLRSQVQILDDLVRKVDPEAMEQEGASPGNSLLCQVEGGGRESRSGGTT